VRLLNVLFALGIIITLWAPAVKAGEFGNVFTPEPSDIEDESREVSSQALRAMELLFQALSIREIQEGTGEEAMSEAATNLLEASERMLELAEQEGFPDFPLDEELLENLLEISGSSPVYREAFEGAETFRQLYSNFANMGLALGASIEEQVGADLNERVFPRFAEALRSYLAVGNAVSTVSEAAAS